MRCLLSWQQWCLREPTVMMQEAWGCLHPHTQSHRLLTQGHTARLDQQCLTAPPCLTGKSELSGILPEITA